MALEINNSHEKDDLKMIEERVETTCLTLAQIQHPFITLHDLSDEQMINLNRKVVRKLDWRLMPCITLMFLMSYLDRINVSHARLAGLQRDLNMTDTTWDAGISTFYVGYPVGQLPGNLWLAKTNPSKFPPGVMLAWSAATICMPAMRNGAGFCVDRFFIGLCEASFFPGITLITSSWYNKGENPTRMATFAAGILDRMEDVANLRAWQWFFLIEGAASILVAVCGFFVLPNWPHNASFMSEQEREMAQYRVLISNGGKEETISETWDGVKEAVKDPFTWSSCGVHFALDTAQSFKDFFTLILETFGFDKTTSYRVQALPYAIAYMSALALACYSGKFQESCLHIVIPIVAAATLISTLNVGARYFGLILLVSGTYNGLNLQLSWETILVPAPRTKEAALIATANCVSHTSHWFSPYFYPTSQEPFYRVGGGLIIAGCVITVMLRV